MMFNTDMIMEALDLKRPLAVADQILLNPKQGKLVERTQDLTNALLGMRESRPEAVAEAMAELGLNLVGAETVWAGYSDAERHEALCVWQESLRYIDPEQATSVVQKLRQEMRSINKGDSLPGLWEERLVLEQGISPIMSFVASMREMIEKCVYWQMFRQKMCKFGNDFARGLRCGRLVGFCQVSTNPVLAFRAYLEDSGLVGVLKERIAKRREWMQNPEGCAREIAMEATLLALMPNLEIFRPLAILTGLKDFQVSFQLNPELADDAEASIEDAKNAFEWAKNYLTQYDRLLGVKDPGALNPNIVFKVAANHPAALRITRELNSLGIPTNITLVYSVSQEVALWIEALRGKAEAARQGLPIARGYVTNMGGRFTSHLRENIAVNIFVKIARKSIARAYDLLNELAKALKIDEAVWQALANMDIETKARVACAYQYLKSLDHPVILRAAQEIGMEAKAIKQLELDLQVAGTLVVQRVWEIFWHPANQEKWIAWLVEEYGLNIEKAAEVVQSIDCLPASKRISSDTLLALSETGMTHTEFPNHARAVQVYAEQAGLSLPDYANSITEGRPEMARRLMGIDDFCRGFTLTPKLYEFLRYSVGIGEATGWGWRGVGPQGWPGYGPCQKTGCEFQKAFSDFVKMCLALPGEIEAERLPKPKINKGIG